MTRAVDQLRAVPGVFDILGDLAPGAPVQRTVDLFTSPGFLYLLADTPQEIERDYTLIRELEQSVLYTHE